MMKTKKLVLLFLIVATGFFLRVYNIDNTPPGIYPDEAVNGIDALTALDSGHYQWFYPANNGREGLFMNIIAFFFWLGGASILTLKLPAILFSTLTILGIYFLTRELTKKEQPALIAAFLVAVSFWSINFARISFRANMLPFVLAFSFYFLWKGLRTKKHWDFVWAGLFFGLGLHTYIAFRIAPVILVAVLILFLITRGKKFLFDYWPQMVTFILFTLVSAAPMFYTFYQHPEYFQSRTGNVSITNPEMNGGSVPLAFLRSFSLSLIKYNIWGDQNWRHNYPPYAILDPTTGIAFTFGLIYSLLRFFQLLSRRLFKGLTDTRLEIHGFLLAWFFLMLAPEFMTAEGNPHALRAIGTLPVTFIFASFTFDYFLRRAYRFNYVFKTITFALISLTLVFVGVFNSVKYHYFWANEPKTAESFNQNIRDIDNYIQTLPNDKDKFLVIESMQRIPLQVFNWNDPHIFYFYPEEVNQIDTRDGDNFEIILVDRKDELIELFQTDYPQLQIHEMTDKYGISFYVFR